MDETGVLGREEDAGIACAGKFLFCPSSRISTEQEEEKYNILDIPHDFSSLRQDRCMFTSHTVEISRTISNLWLLILEGKQHESVGNSYQLRVTKPKSGAQNRFLHIVAEIVKGGNDVVVLESTQNTDVLDSNVAGSDLV